MKASNKGFDQCGNAQAVVDGQCGVAIAADVTGQANDKRQFQPMMRQAKENVGRGRKIEKACADTGYFSEENARWAKRARLDAYVATGRSKHNEKIPQASRGRAPAGLSLKERMARKLRTKKGRAIYAARKWIAEPLFGFVKRGLGFAQFLLNGMEKMRRRVEIGLHGVQAVGQNFSAFAITRTVA